jgi:hypothetical protein
MIANVPDRVQTTIAGHEVEADVVDAEPDARYGPGPATFLVVELPSGGRYRVLNEQATPV